MTIPDAMSRYAIAKSLQPMRWRLIQILSIAAILGLSGCDLESLLADPKVDVVYIAVPHNLHEEIYLAAVAAG